MRKKKNQTVERYYVDYNQGLNKDQVAFRKAHKQVNKSKKVVGKTYWEIILTDILSFFNIVLFVIAFLLIIAQAWTNLFFLFIIVPNMLIGLYQDIKAKVLLSKLNLLSEPKAKVIRDSETVLINVNDIVLDDVMMLESGNQISADGIVLSGKLMVNESLLTGESRIITKNVNDIVYSGSFVVSGKAYVKADKVGNNKYISTIEQQANKFKRSGSEILKSLKGLFRVIGIFVIVLALATGIIYYLQGSFNDFESFKAVIPNICGSLLAMIPSGLYLLTTMTLATTVVSLAKKNAQVHDFYSVEMLARANVLCVDKTGTITDGMMVVDELLSLNGMYSLDELRQIVSNVLSATDDNNLTALSLRKFFDKKLDLTIKAVLPFNSENKYSAASFTNGKTYLFGALEYINLKDKELLKETVNQYTTQGKRVLLVAESKEVIKGESLQEICEPIGLIIMNDHVRETAISSFKWFQDNNVEIKVISGDDVETVKNVVAQVGINNSQKAISLDGMSLEEVKSVALKYSVFARVKPDQKEALVKALQEAGKTVAMTGDGVNDVLALKRADCSIAMREGADAAKNVSHIVLLDSNFDSLPSVVAEGRRVVNNIQRTASVFLCKTIFAIILTLLFLTISTIKNDSSIKYPFTPNNMYIWEILGIGLTAFFLALEPNSEQMKKGSFLKSVFKTAVPGGLFIVLSTLSVYGLYLLQEAGAFRLGIDSFESATTMAILVFSVNSLVVLFVVCSPFSKYRKIIYSSAAFLSFVALLACFLLTTLKGIGNVLGINFNSLWYLNYIETLIIIVLSSEIYLSIIYMIKKIKEIKDVKD